MEDPILGPLDLVDVATLAALLRVSTRTVYRWIRRGDLPQPFRPSRRSLKRCWRTRQLAELFEAREREAQQQQQQPP